VHWLKQQPHFWEGLCCNRDGCLAIINGLNWRSLLSTAVAAAVQIMDRKGFVRIAVESGTPIVPVYHFGNSKLFRCAAGAVVGGCSSGAVCVDRGVWGREAVVWIVCSEMPVSDGLYDIAPAAVFMSRRLALDHVKVTVTAMQPTRAGAAWHEGPQTAGGLFLVCGVLKALRSFPQSSLQPCHEASLPSPTGQCRLLVPPHARTSNDSRGFVMQFVSSLEHKNSHYRHLIIIPHTHSHMQWDLCCCCSSAGWLPTGWSGCAGALAWLWATPRAAGAP